DWDRQAQRRPCLVRCDIGAAAVLQESIERWLGIADRRRHFVRLPIADGARAERRNIRISLRCSVLEAVDLRDVLLLHPGVPGRRCPDPRGTPVGPFLRSPPEAPAKVFLRSGLQGYRIATGIPRESRVRHQADGRLARGRHARGGLTLVLADLAPE